ncbi:MAG: DUF5798 family protein [Halolamina sp.]
MGLGSTAKKVQKLAEVAEQTFKRIDALRDEVDEMRQTVGDTADRVERLESEMAEQRALLNAVAEEQGIDVDAVSASSHIVDAERDGEVDGDTAADDSDGDDATTAANDA